MFKIEQVRVAELMAGKSIVINSRENQRLANRPPPAETDNGISTLAHEINNPLEALHQLHYLIEKEATPTEKGRQYLSLAREEVERISQILHAAMELRDSGDPEETASDPQKCLNPMQRQRFRLRSRF